MRRWTGSTLAQVIACRFVRRKAIILTNVALLLIGPLGTNFIEIRIEIKTPYIHENAFETIVFEMATILSRGGDDLIVNNNDKITVNGHFFSLLCDIKSNGIQKV